MASDERPLSVAEVCELVPGDKENVTWINQGVSAVVRSIVKRTTGAGRPMFVCELADQTGSATAEMTVFAPPKFREGDLIEISGKGIRRTEYNGKAQVSVGKTAEIHVVGHSVHHEEQKERAATGQPAIDGSKQANDGPTVGMALKEALALLTRDLPENSLLTHLQLPKFWSDVHLVASDIVRLSRAIKAGNLAPSVRERAGGPRERPAAGPAAAPAPGGPPAAGAPPATRPPAATRTPPTDFQLSNVDPNQLDEDVPF